jgi:hypothetical protein
MGNKVVTEADRKRTAAPKTSEGFSALKRTAAVGQKSSRARGSATRTKKNPGKRPHQG